MANGQPVDIFVAEVEAFGGAERALLALSRWLHRHGIAHRMLTYEDRIGLEKYAQHPIEVLQLHPAGGVRAKIAALKQHLRGREQQRLLCSGYQPALHATLARASGFHCLMHDTPSLFDDEASRGLTQAVRLKVSNAIIGFGLRSGGVTMVNSDFLMDECRRDFRVNAVLARMGGLPPATGFHERHVDGTLRMLSVCRIESNKRIDWMLHALAALERDVPSLSSRADWQLTIAGKGSQISALQRQAEELGMAGRVHFSGFVSDAQLQVLMAEAHLFLMPAVQGFGIPALEALQAGMPVLLHRRSGVSDLLLETPWATVFDGDQDAMVPALRFAIEGVLNGRQIGHPLPPFATEDQWAEQVAQLCGWLQL